MSCKALRDQIQKAAFSYPVGGPNRFVPRGTLPSILTEDAVHSALQDCLDGMNLPPENLVRLAAVVCRGEADQDGASYRKIFATLLHFGGESRILDFIGGKINDANLPLLSPLCDISRDSGLGTLHGEMAVLYLKSDANYLPLEFLRDWDPSKLTAFYEEQWSFVAPFFENPHGRVQHYKLRAHDILPIIEDLGAPEISPLGSQISGRSSIFEVGGASELSRIKLHENHYRFTYYKAQSSNNNSFAMKRMEANHKDLFCSEVRALKAANDLGSAHIIRLLATFELPGRGCYLLFPCATGDLNYFWRTHPELERQSQTAFWMAKQCYEIASAMTKIHDGPENESASGSRSLGRHGDIKASNILWFANATEWNPATSALVIADLGLGESYAGPTAGGYTDNETLVYTPSYRAPEFDLPAEKRRIFNAVDVWSLACTYLEFITWYLQGWDGVEVTFPSFRLDTDAYGMRSDAFFRKVGEQMEVKPQVLQWMRDLHVHRSCTQYMHDFLDIISGGMLEVNPEHRTSAKKVAEKLREIYNRCLDNVDYYVTEKPWSGE